jgi:hypothetical protein
MRFKTTWILLAVLIIIIAYFIFIDERQRSMTEAERDSSRELFPYGPVDVQRLVFIAPEGDTIDIERSLDGWRITRPVVTPGSRSTIESILLQTVPGQKLEEYTDVEKLADFGLAEPFASVILFSADRAAPDTIFVGDKTATTDRSYVRIGGSRSVIITREMTRNVMNKNLYHLRDKNFLPYRTPAVEGFTVFGNGESYSLARFGQGWWIRPPGFRGDSGRVERYLDMLTEALIYGFPAEDLENAGTFGLAPAQKRLTVRAASGETEIRFGNRSEDMVFAARSGLDKVLLLKENLLKIFQWTPDDLRAMNLAFFDPASVKTLKLETPDSSIVIAERGGAWRFEGDDMRTLNGDSVKRLLDRFKRLTFTEITSEPLAISAFSLEEDSRIFTLLDARGEAVDIIKLSVSQEGYEMGLSRSADARGLLVRNAFDAIEEALRDAGLFR